MPDTQDLDQVRKAIGKLVDDWGKTVSQIAKQMEKLQAAADKNGNGDKSAAKDDDKDKEKLKKEAEDANKELMRKILSVKIPPKADPKLALKLPDLIAKNISENGVKIGDYGSVKPDIDFDPKKMQFKKVGVTWTWEW